MKLKNQYIFLSLVVAGLLLAAPIQTLSQTATVPLSITVNGNLTISDANNDASSGKDPTLNVNLSITPDLGAAAAIGNANFRIRTNRSSWKLVAQRTSEVDSGPTNISASDVGLLVTTQAGSKANPDAGSLVAPFNTKTDISKVPTSTPVNVVLGKLKTSRERDNTNSNNYFQINTQYSIAPDFFYQPGTWKTTITYNLVSP
jgi:hypothetical protein